MSGEMRIAIILHPKYALYLKKICVLVFSTSFVR